MSTKLQAHNPRQDGTEVADWQMRIGDLREEGLMDIDRESFREGRSATPELKDHFIHPIQRQAKAAGTLVLIDRAIDLIKQQNPELALARMIEDFVKKSHHNKKYDDISDVEKTNLPPSDIPEDSVSELSVDEREEKRTG